MKLIYCKICQDVYKLSDHETRHCKCRATWGKYLSDKYTAEYYGEYAIPLGFANSSLREALANQPLEGDGKVFTAFVIPQNCPTMTHLTRESIIDRHLKEKP